MPCRYITMTMSSVRRLVVLILIGGTLLSILAARSVSGSRDAAVEQTLVDETDEIVAELDRLTAGAFDVVQNLGDIVSSDWQTADEYRLLWPSYRDALPGDSAALLLTSVPATQLDSFLAAQEAIDEGFFPSIVNSAPPASGHVFIIASSDESQPVGADLSTIPGAADVFTNIDADTIEVRGSDFRSPVNTPAGQAQLIYRTTAERPDGQDGYIWNVIQVDTAAFLEIAMAGRDGFGAQLTLNVNDQLVDNGIEMGGAVTQTRATAGTNGLAMEVTVWTDGSTIVSRSASSVFWSTLLGTIGFATLVGLGTTAFVLARRAESGEREARHDELTGLPNRRWVMERLQASKGDIAVMFCDLDRFKVVNDSVGHASGDELLVRVSERIVAIVGERGEVARFGGDEFIILIQGRGDTYGQSIEVATELVTSMGGDPFIIEAGSFRTSMSVGLAMGNTNQIHGDELIRAADVALGRAKTNGRDTFVVYDNELREHEIGRLKLESELQDALDAQNLTVHFQPIVDSEKHVCSYEALVRWEHRGELISPGAFLPVVEDMGRMVDLGEIVLRKAIKIFTEVTDSDDATTLHINVDASQLLDPNFPQTVRDVVEEFDLDPSRLILELTEGEWVDSNEDLETVLLELANGGFAFAIDDFGSGYSSLGRLLTVPGLAEIKIDRSMVMRSMDPRTGAIVAGLVEIADRLEVALVAEGVEKTEEFAVLRRAGIPYFQGYLFGRPVPLSADDYVRPVDQASNGYTGHDAELDAA